MNNIVWWMILFMKYVSCSESTLSSYYNVNLPFEHMKFFFHINSKASEACKKVETCPYKTHLDKKACWGYENNCSVKHRYSSPVCIGNSRGWVKTKEEQLNTFYIQGDFGYVKERKEELTVFCRSENPDSSFLECSKFIRFCRARNIMFDFERLLNIQEPMRYRDDVIKENQVGGFCKLSRDSFLKEGHHRSPLQSWFAELEHFTELPSNPIKSNLCDIILDRPTYIMKLDATVNMYHHFCDFVNLYATLHLNNTFSTDVNILIWDTVPYHSNFEITWKAFTDHPVLNLDQFKGKKVCFKDAVFPLLPRMIFGMYYNMPLIPGCYGSGLFHAFNRHILHKLDVKQELNRLGNVRITVISRTTQYRRILNEDELINAMKTVPDFEVKKVNFNRLMPFIEQMKISHNTDILIGVHGAGLTHMLFMPDWGSVFEIYNCEDENCYADLARLRGLFYLTWENNDKLHAEDEGHHPTLGAHAKFTNYKFEVKEFMRLVQKAADYVRMHPAFVITHRRETLQSSDPHTEL